MKLLMLNKSSIWAGLLLNALLTAEASCSTMVSLNVEVRYNSNPIVANSSAAVGGGNTIAGPASLGIGWGNQQLSGYCTLLIGEYHYAEANSGLMIGCLNQMYGYYNTNSGIANSVGGSRIS